MNGLPGPERPARLYLALAGCMVVAAPIGWGILQLAELVAG